MEQWCPHIIKQQQGYFGSDISSFYAKRVPSDWDICPMIGCHNPRPKPKKTLAEVLSDYRYSHQDISWEHVASKAREYILEGEDKINGVFEIIFNGSRSPVGYKDTAKAILDYLKKESQ